MGMRNAHRLLRGRATGAMASAKPCEKDISLWCIPPHRSRHLLVIES